MPSNAHLRTELLRTLDCEIQHASDLMRHLRRESEAVSSSDASALTDSLNEKEQTLKLLEAATVSRIGLMQQHGYSADGSGIQHCIDSVDEGDQLHQRFLTLEELATECRQANTLAAQVTNRRLQFISGALQILQRTESTEDKTYQRDGNIAASAGAHRLSSA